MSVPLKWPKDRESERRAGSDALEDAHPFAPPLSRFIVSPTLRMRQPLFS
jgi:hypothetical protein